MSLTTQVFNQFIVKQPSIDTILNNVYNNNQEKVSILNGNVSKRYMCILNFLKKNNIEITKDKLLLLCFLLKKKYDYSGDDIKIVDMDYYTLDKDNSKIQFDIIKKNLFKILLLSSVIWLDIRGKDLFIQKPIYKYLFLILVFGVIIGYIFYVYTKDYRKEEIKTINILNNKIFGLELINNLQYFVDNIKDANNDSSLFIKMLELINIDVLRKYSNIKEYIEKSNINQEQIIETEDKVEDKVEVETEDKVEDKVEVETEDKVEDKVEVETEDKVEDKAEVEVEDKAEDKVEDKTEVEVEVEVGNKAEVEVEEKVEEKVEDKVEVEVEDKVEVEIEAEDKVEDKVEEKVEVEAEAEDKPKRQYKKKQTPSERQSKQNKQTKQTKQAKKIIKNKY